LKLKYLVAAAAFAGALLPATARADVPPLSASYTAADISGTNHQWYVTGTTTTTSTIATTGVVTFNYPVGTPATTRHDVNFTSTLKPTCQIAGTTSTPPYTVPSLPQVAPWTASCRFDAPGTYQFMCQVHRSMTGTVNVVGTSVEQPVSGTVPATLSLGIGNAASLGTFALGVDADYTASLAATVTSTAGDATLTAADPSANAPGHLVNGPYVMAQPLEVRATNAANPDTSYAPLGDTAAPVTLLAWPGPVSADSVTVGFKQPVGATDPLRTGNYAKTVVFTLTTANP
jgi:hypothetical protein